MIKGLGEVDFGSQKMQSSEEKQQISQKSAGTDRPYLLLDVRDDDDYAVCHIITGMHI